METATQLNLAGLTALTPTVAVIFAYLFGRSDLRELRVETKAEMKAGFEKVDTRIDKVDKRIEKLAADYTEFYGLQKKLEGRVVEISKQ